MYLLYVDNEFITSVDINGMVEQSTDDTDIINCFSTATLLRTAERLKPEIIIIDFELVKDRLSELFSDLRAKSEQTYVMALINPDNYEKLYRAIEAGAIDDYIVKPIRKEEFLARVRIAAKKNKRIDNSSELSDDGVLGGGMLLDFERRKSKPQEEQTEPEDDFIEPVEEEGKIEESDEELRDIDDQFQDDAEEESIDEPWDITEDDKDFILEADQSGAAPVKPSADFLDDVTLKAPEDDESTPIQHAQAPSEEVKPEESSFDTDFDDDLSFDLDTDENILTDEDDQIFDQLFEEKADTQPDESTPFDEPENTPAAPTERKSLREISELPGETADDFLFGESSEADEQSEEVKLDDLIEEGTLDTFQKKEKQDDQVKDKKGKGGFLKFFSILGNVLFVLLLLIMAILSFFLIQSRIAGGVPEVAGYQMYIVLSGSMSPEFDTGSLAFVQEVDTGELAVGDIITYRSRADSDSLTTHRIVDIMRNDSVQFVTRGDANNVNDPNPVLAENVVGRVTGSVPYVGYVLDFVQTRQGLILLIFVPGVLIIAYELSKIIKYLTRDNKGKEKNRNKDSGDTRFVQN